MIHVAVIFQSHGSALRELRLGRFDGLLGTTRIAGVSEPSLQVLPPAAVPQVEVIVARATCIIDIKVLLSMFNVFFFCERLIN